MTLLDIAISEARAVVKDVRGFGIPLTITALQNDEYIDSVEIIGLATVHSQGFDSDGLPTIMDNSHVLISEKDLNDLDIVTRDEEGKLDLHEWKISFTHNIGTVNGKFAECMPDSTLGLIRCFITRYDVEQGD